MLHSCWDELGGTEIGFPSSFSPLRIQSEPALSKLKCRSHPGLVQPSWARGASQAEDPKPHLTTVNRKCLLPVSGRRQNTQEEQTSNIPPEIPLCLHSVTSFRPGDQGVVWVAWWCLQCIYDILNACQDLLKIIKASIDWVLNIVQISVHKWSSWSTIL